MLYNSNGRLPSYTEAESSVQQEGRRKEMRVGGRRKKGAEREGEGRVKKCLFIIIAIDSRSSTAGFLRRKYKACRGEEKATFRFENRMKGWTQTMAFRREEEEG